MRGFLLLLLLALSAAQAKTSTPSDFIPAPAKGLDAARDLPSDFSPAPAAASARKRDVVLCPPELSGFCQNGGTCVETGMYTCICPKTFYGIVCQFQTFVANLSGQQEIPPNNSTYTGVAFISHYALKRTVIVKGESTVVGVTAAHIHRGASNENGGVIVPIPFIGDFFLGISQPYTLSEADSELLLNGRTYVNIHNSEFPAGAIRGQIVPYDACEPNPCQNNGTCKLSSITGFDAVCTCPPGFVGPSCEIAIPQCAENFCLNGGLCLLFDSIPSCACDSQHFGEFCEMYQGNELCALDPCQNGGTCIGDVAVLNACECAEGYFGLFCEATNCTGPVCSATATYQAIGQNPISATSSIFYDGPIFPTTKVRIWTNISHPNNGELQIMVNTPGGYFLMAFKNAEGIADAFAGTYWTWDAEFSVKDYPYVSGVAATEIRPSTLTDMGQVFAYPTGSWTLVILDTVPENDGFFYDWRVEFDHGDDCEGIVCPEGKICVDGFEKHSCLTPSPDGPCLASQTCLFGSCQPGGYCECHPGYLGEYCAILPTTCTPTSCALVGTLAPISNDLPPRRSSLPFAGLPNPLPPHAGLKVNVEIFYPYNDDLILTLISPSGTRVVLGARVGGSFEGLYRAISFSDSAPKTLRELPIYEDQALLLATAKPQEPFSTFDGEDPNGNWVLEIVDVASGNSGNLVGWSLLFDLEDGCQASDENGTAVAVCPPEYVCIDETFAVSCECPPGTGGISCEPVSPCNPNPCQDGFCSVNEAGNDYMCNCFGLAAGRNCELAICEDEECLAYPLAPISQSLPPIRSSVALSPRGTISATTHFILGLDLVHAKSNELVITLTSPSGTTIVLSEFFGGKDTFLNFTFDSMANTPIANFDDETSLPSYLPMESFGAFVGDDSGGIWTLEVTDYAYGEDGALLNWMLELSGKCPSTNPCKNGGQCVDGLVGYTCNCAGTGFEGQFCESNVNDCSPNPCKNGGQCLDKVKGFTCNCAGTGYSGTTCGTNVNECLAKPCKNGAACTDLPGDYRCDCPVGFSGKNCDINKDDCPSPNPCQNGVRCLDGLDTFRCQCESINFDGPTCSFQPITITATTSTAVGAETTGTISILLIGATGNLGPYQLPGPFDKGAVSTFFVNNTVPIGELYTIRLTNSKKEDPWTVATVVINYGGRVHHFGKEKVVRSSFQLEAPIYVRIRTVNHSAALTIATIFATFKDTEGRASSVQLGKGFKRGSTVDLVFRFRPITNITSITLASQGSDEWIFSSIEVEKRGFHRYLPLSPGGLQRFNSPWVLTPIPFDPYAV